MNAISNKIAPHTHLNLNALIPALLTWTTVICILFCTINFREHYLVVLQFDIFGQ